jgi:hypothetical protein
MIFTSIEEGAIPGTMRVRMKPVGGFLFTVKGEVFLTIKDLTGKLHFVTYHYNSGLKVFCSGQHYNRNTTRNLETEVQAAAQYLNSVDTKELEELLLCFENIGQTNHRIERIEQLVCYLGVL